MSFPAGKNTQCRISEFWNWPVQCRGVFFLFTTLTDYIRKLLGLITVLLRCEISYAWLQKAKSGHDNGGKYYKQWAVFKCISLMISSRDHCCNTNSGCTKLSYGFTLRSGMTRPQLLSSEAVDWKYEAPHEAVLSAIRKFLASTNLALESSLEI